jgi:hypothetical protein
MSLVPDTVKRPVSTLPRIPDASILELNVSAALLAEELLALPSGAAAEAAVNLLWPGGPALPARFLEAVGSGAALPVGRLALSRPPLAVAVAPTPASALNGAWSATIPLAEAADHAQRHARSQARARYRDLQTALLRGAGQADPASLLGYVYGVAGRPWPWAAAAQRLLGRVTALNRAMLRASQPSGTLDGLAESLPPLAAVDFARLTLALEAPVAEADAAVSRHRALFAEMLGRAVAVAS